MAILAKTNDIVFTDNAYQALIAQQQASNAQGTANDANTAAGAAQNTANTANTNAGNAQTSANNAQNSANAAMQKAIDAFNAATDSQTSADGKNTIYYGQTIPAHPHDGDIWFKDNGDSTITIEQYQNNAWITPQEQAIKDAQQLANSALSTANGKNQISYGVSTPTNPKDGDIWYKGNADGTFTMQQYKSGAWSAPTDSATKTAQDTADQAKSLAQAAQTAANNAQSTANGKNKIYHGTTTPASAQDGDIWFKDNGDSTITIEQYQSGSWIAPTQQDLQNAIDAANDAASDAQTAQNTADGKNTIYYGTTQPSTGKDGDIWYKDNGNSTVTMYQYKGTAWSVPTDSATKSAQTTANNAQTAANNAQISANNAQTSANGKNTNYYGTTTPSSPKSGDLWFKTVSGGVQTLQYNGSAWVSATDVIANNANTTISGNKSVWDRSSNINSDGTFNTTKLSGTLTDAQIASASTWTQGITDAKNAASAAQTTANGKNRIFRQAGTPTGSFVTGDTWFDTANGNRASVWNGSSWVLSQFGNAAVANLDAGSITSGYIAAARIQAGSIDSTKIAANTITAGNIASGAIGTDELAANAVTAGKIAAKTITAAQMETGTITAASGIIGSIDAGTISTGILDAGLITVKNLAIGSFTDDTLAQISNANVQVGVRNYVIGTSSPTSITGQNISNQNTGDSSYGLSSKFLSSMSVGDYITISFDWESIGNSPSGYFDVGFNRTPWWEASITNHITLSSSNVKGHFTGTKQVTADFISGGTDQVRIRLDNVPTSITINISNLKYEAGNKATAWSPAPEDQDSYADSVSSTAQTNAQNYANTQFNPTKSLVSGWVTNATYINGGMINTGSITSTQIAAKTIVADDIAAGTLTSASGVFGVISANNVSTGTLNAANVSVINLNATNITGGALSMDRIAAGAITGTKIAAKTITATNMVAGTITADSGVIGSINANVITTGTLNGNLLGANTVTANKIAIGDFTNYVDDPIGNKPNLWEYGLHLTYGDVVFTSNSDGSYIQLDGSSGVASKTVVAVKANDQFSVELDAFNSGGLTGNAGGFRILDADTMASIGVYDFTPNGHIQYIFTVPSGTTHIRFAYQIALTAGAIGIRNMSMRRMVAGQLIVDGSITASDIQAGTLTSASGVFGVISANNISTGTLNAALVSVVNLNASNITAGTLDASKVNVTNINANNLTAGTISGISINGNTITGGTITGATINGNTISGGSISGATITGATLISTANGAGQVTIGTDSEAMTIKNGDSWSRYEATAITMYSGSVGAVMDTNHMAVWNGSTGTNVYYDHIVTPSITTGSIKMSWTDIQSANGTWRISLGDDHLWLGNGYDTQIQQNLMVAGGTVYDNNGRLQLWGKNGSSSPGGGSGDWGCVTLYAHDWNSNWKSDFAVGYDDSGSRIWSSSINARTYSGANVHVTDSGTLGITSSATKYKENIKHDVSTDYADQILNLKPASWHDKAEDEALARSYELGVTDADDRYNHKIVGAIAEEVEALGLDEFVYYGAPNKAGIREVEGIMYDQMWVLLIPAINHIKAQHQEEIDQLKDQNEILKQTNQALVLQNAEFEKRLITIEEKFS